MLHGNGFNASAGSAQCAPTDIGTYQIGNIQGGSQGYDTATPPGNTWIDFNWRDTDGTQIPNAWFTAFASDLSPGYKQTLSTLGIMMQKQQNAWNFRYSDGTTDAFDHQANHSGLSVVLWLLIYPLLYRILD